MKVIVSKYLPIEPTAGEQGRRRVRHGMADVLEWLGEIVGPEPGELVHTFRAGGDLYVSQETYDVLVQYKVDNIIQ